jgi:hypothetical protein
MLVILFRGFMGVIVSAGIVVRMPVFVKMLTVTVRTMTVRIMTVRTMRMLVVTARCVTHAPISEMSW